MLMAVEELKKYIDTDTADAVLEAMLQSLELAIRGYTHNNFQNVGCRVTATVQGDKIICDSPHPFVAGDTVQISQSASNNGLYVVAEVLNDETIRINGTLSVEYPVLVTRIDYPADVKYGAAKLIKWELDSGDKVGIQSETISRHSVTYFNMDGDNSTMGYPKSLVGFLMPHRKARF